MFDNRRVSGDLQIFCDRDKNQSRTNYVVLQPELGGSKGPRKISDKYSFLRLLYMYKTSCYTGDPRLTRILCPWHIA